MNLSLVYELRAGLPAGLLSYKQNSKKGSEEIMLKDRTEWDRELVTFRFFVSKLPFLTSLPFLVSSEEESIFFLKASFSCLQARGELRND